MPAGETITLWSSLDALIIMVLAWIVGEILAPTRWKLKKAVRELNLVFNKLKLDKHPDKTCMGRTEKGFDFLGFHFGPKGLSPSCKTIDNIVNCVEK